MNANSSISSRSTVVLPAYIMVPTGRSSQKYLMCSCGCSFMLIAPSWERESSGAGQHPTAISTKLMAGRPAWPQPGHHHDSRTVATHSCKLKTRDLQGRRNIGLFVKIMNTFLSTFDKFYKPLYGKSIVRSLVSRRTALASSSPKLSSNRPNSPRHFLPSPFPRKTIDTSP